MKSVPDYVENMSYDDRKKYSLDMMLAGAKLMTARFSSKEECYQLMDEVIQYINRCLDIKDEDEKQ